MSEIPPNWQVSFPEAEQWTGHDRRPIENATDAIEEIKERDWAELEAVARDFVKRWGATAMLRCVSDALDAQPGLFK